MANTRFSDWARRADPSSTSTRSGVRDQEGAALRVQDAAPQQRKEGRRRRRYGCALLLFCEELLSLHRVQVESTRGLTVLTDHAATANGGVHTRVKVTKRSTPGNFFLFLSNLRSNFQNSFHKNVSDHIYIQVEAKE